MRPYRKNRVGMWTSRDQQVDPGKHRNRLKGGCDFRLLKRLGCCLNASRCYLKGQFASGNYERFVIYELPHRADSNDMNCEESPLGRTFSLFPRLIKNNMISAQTEVNKSTANFLTRFAIFLGQWYGRQKNGSIFTLIGQIDANLRVRRFINISKKVLSRKLDRKCSYITVMDSTLYLNFV
jgi:hypothetical protein